MSSQAMTQEQIRHKGLEALMQALGPVGTIRFLQQFETGSGDYSTERHELLDKLKLESIIAQAREKEKFEKS